MTATVERYLALYAQRVRPATLVIKRGNLRRLIRFLQAHHPAVRSWRDLRRQPHIEEWMRHLYDSGLKSNTRLLHIGTAMLFFDDLAQWGWPEAPEPGLLYPEDRPRQEHHLPKPFVPQADLAIQQALALEPNLPAIALRLLRLTGMRFGEMRDLPLNAIRDQGLLLVPLGKTRSERVVPICAQVHDLLQTILQQRGTQLGHAPLPPASAPFLMVDPRGYRINRAACARTLKRIAQPLLPDEHVHVHRLRHTYATQMIRAGMSVQVLMKILGHVNPAMTLRYAEVSASDLRAHYEQAIQHMAAIKNLPIPQPPIRPESPVLAQDLLAALIRHMEALSRDYARSSFERPLRRFVKRLRKTGADLTAFMQILSPDSQR